MSIRIWPAPLFLGALSGAFLAACGSLPASRPAKGAASAESRRAPSFAPSSGAKPAFLQVGPVGDMTSFPLWSAPPPPVLPGQRYGFYSVECAVTDVPGRKSSRCAERTSPINPLEKVWVDRLNQCFRLSRRKFSGGPDAPSDAAAFRLVVTHTTTLIDEVVVSGCESARGRPCDPVAMRTGKRVRQTITRNSLLPPEGGKMGFWQLDGAVNVFSPEALVFFFFVPLYSGKGGALLADERFSYDPSAPNEKMRALAQRLAAIGAATDVEVVRAAVALDRAWLSLRLKDRQLIATAAAELQRFVDRQLLDGARTLDTTGQSLVSEHIERLLPILRQLDAGSLLFEDPCIPHLP
jgi:hypothetical protein